MSLQCHYTPSNVVGRLESRNLRSYTGKHLLVLLSRFSPLPQHSKLWSRSLHALSPSGPCVRLCTTEESSSHFVFGLSVP